MSEPFLIEDKETADWALEKIRLADEEVKENRDYADLQIDKVMKWEQEVNKEHTDTIEFMESHLQKYLMDNGIKSMKLINGNMGFRKRQPKWTIQSTDKLVETLESIGLNDLVRVKKEPALAEMKKQFTIHNGKAINTETGEAIEGITIEEQAASFNVKTN